MALALIFLRPRWAMVSSLHRAVYLLRRFKALILAWGRHTLILPPLARKASTWVEMLVGLLIFFPFFILWVPLYTIFWKCQALFCIKFSHTGLNSHLPGYRYSRRYRNSRSWRPNCRTTCCPSWRL